ncbi:MAG: hypothetical protein AB1445_05355 [Bacillota bacterium]
MFKADDRFLLGGRVHPFVVVGLEPGPEQLVELLQVQGALLQQAVGFRLTNRARRHLEHLCTSISHRSVGSKGNHVATRNVAGCLANSGWAVELQEFECLDWRQDGVMNASIPGDRGWGFPPALGVHDQ